jgi:LPS sulfotransferase NodH
MRPYQRRADPELTETFAKDAGEEDFLEHLNAVLAPHEEAGYLDLEERFPTLHVIGAPRSGTTLLYQLVASGLEVGYVNNLVAAFWRAPATGIRLSRKLRVEAESSFDSSFGRTRGIQEPHEFGYFWNHHLRYPDLAERPAGHEAAIDWDGLRTVIVNMAHAYGGPVAFKPMLLLWHLEAMVRCMPRTCYVWIRRDQRDTALSLMKMRQGLRGSYEAWTSLRPLADLDGEPPWRQVAAQVVLLERTIEEAARRLGPEHVLPVRYERMCAEPVAVLEEIRDLMGAKGHAPELRRRDLARFREQRNEALDAEFGARIDEALEHYGGLVAEQAAGGR